ncbi:MAG: hypothetical protein KatS3mg095_0739 [Candidatus Parcubacteria bacterium]|nr:MAG: hypothetical protein KatS3mg095_0739 [Candidatus Parcubacteria bacterium]
MARTPLSQGGNTGSNPVSGKFQMRYLITTSIPYVNDNPHIGHLYEFILADVFARYLRNNNEVFFLSGTDENGIKIARSAIEKGRDIFDFVNEKYSNFYSLKDKFYLSFDNFIRTTSEEHKKAVYKFWNLCKDDIYLDKYSGYYCYSCEAYYEENDLEKLICPLHNKKLEKIEESNYFFRLTKYLSKVNELISQDKIKIYPQEKKIEILNILKEKKIKDLSISRDIKRSYGWGIKVPNDNSQVIYVWFDALINYLSGLGFGSNNQNNFQKYWQAGEIIHFIGKDIVKFHAIYWPAMLLSAKIKPPEKIVVHYFINVRGEKMSKTIGNVIAPEDLLNNGIESDIIRAYFCHQNIFNDWDFSFKNLINFKDGILKKELGNLILRIFGLVKKYDNDIELKNNLLENKTSNILDNFEKLMNIFEINLAYQNIFDLVKILNQFIDQKKVWNNLNEENMSTLIINLIKIIETYSLLLPKTLNNIKEKIEIKNNIFLNKKISLNPIFK